jgi:hypothetical protein
VRFTGGLGDDGARAVFQTAAVLGGRTGGAGAPPATGGHAFGVGRGGVRWTWDVWCVRGACNLAGAASDPKLALRVRGVRFAAGGMWFWGGRG